MPHAVVGVVIVLNINDAAKQVEKLLPFFAFLYTDF
jgi:hypothetical protein